VNLRHRAAGSEAEQVGDEFSNLLQRDGSDVRARRLDDAVDTDGHREVRLGDTEPDDINLGQPSTSPDRAGYDCDRVLPELEHVIGGDDDRRSDEPRLAPRRRPEVAADDVTRPHQRHRSQTYGARPRRQRRVGRLPAAPR